MGSLPLVPDLEAGESLASHRRRTLVLNLHPTGPVLRASTRQQLEEWPEHAGLHFHAADEATLRRYAPSVVGRGRRRSAVSRTWRLPLAAGWSCPQCTLRDGIIRRDWQLACHPVCTACGHLLTPANTTAPGAVQVDPATRAWQEGIEALLERSITSSSARSVIGSAYRYAALIALVIDDDWPTPTTGEDPAIRAAVIAEGLQRDWSQRVPTDPAQVLAVAVPAFDQARRAAQGSVLADRMVMQAWERINAQPNLAHLAATPPRWLPRPPHRHLARPLPDPATHVPLARLRQVLRLPANARLEPRHVPALLLQPGERFLPPLVDVATRKILAAVLHHELSHELSDFAASLEKLALDPDLSDHPVAIPYVKGVGLRRRDTALITTATTDLLDRGLVDFAELRSRSSVLLDHQSTTRALSRDLRATSLDLIGAWAWTDRTGGPPPHATAGDLERLRQFDEALDPETRLRIRERAEELLTFTDLDAHLKHQNQTGRRLQRRDAV